MFFRRQVLVKATPGAKVVPSGTVTSLMNCALSQEEGGTVAVIGEPVFVGVGVGGVPVTVGVAVAVEPPARERTGLPQMARSPVALP